jgi:hypothetical protein
MEGSGHPYHWLHIRLFLEYFSSLYANRTSAKPYEESARSMFVPITFSHNLCTSLSTSCLHFMRFSIHPSRVGIDAGSVDGTDDNCEGSGIFTSSIFVSMIVVGGERCEGLLSALHWADDVQQRNGVARRPVGL